MRQVFAHHHQLTEEQQDRLWEACTFVFDASTLLNIYRYSDKTRDDLFLALQKLEQRIRIPYQAAKEFYSNRVDVIIEQRGKYQKARESLDLTLNALNEFNRSAFLEVDHIKSMLQPVDQAKQRLDQQKSNHLDLMQSDPYVEKLEGIIGQKVGLPPEDKAFAEACALAETRINRKQPPGYEDAKKPSPQKYGDVLIWFEILNHASVTNKPVIFVTDDRKEDWWLIVEHKKSGPRPELREEIRKRASVDFHIVTPDHFLDRLGKLLKLNIAEASVEDARQVGAEAFSQTKSGGAAEWTSLGGHMRGGSIEAFMQAQSAVQAWIRKRDPGVVITVDPLGGRFDLVQLTSDKRRVGIIVFFFQNKSGRARSRLHERAMSALDMILAGSMENYRCFVISQSIDIIRHYAHVFGAHQSEHRCYDLSLGLLNSELEYEEVLELKIPFDLLTPRK